MKMQYVETVEAAGPEKRNPLSGELCQDLGKVRNIPRTEPYGQLKQAIKNVKLDPFPRKSQMLSHSRDAPPRPETEFEISDQDSKVGSEYHPR
jgi:hypothetical protein